MQLTKVRVENYRSLRHAEFTLSNLCALIGGNNVGKSNVLSAINLVLGDRWPSLSSVDDRDFYGYDNTDDLAVSVWFDEAREVRGDVGEPVQFTGIRFRVTHYQRRTGEHAAGDPRAEFQCIDDAGESVHVLVRPNPNARPYQRPASVTQEIRDAVPAVLVDVDRNASRHLSGSQWSILGRLLKQVATEFRSDPGRVREFKQAFEIARGFLRTPGFEDLRTRVIGHLAAHTGLRNIEIILDDVDPMNVYRTFSVLFKDPDTPTPVDAERMGTGIQSAVVIALLQAYRELRRENAVLLFEEPELFLHPHGRRHLFRLLKDLSETGTQIIYTTHSDEFIDLERLDGLRLVTKGTAMGTIVSAPSTEALPADWRDRARIASRMGGSKAEILFADTVILAEGATERAAVRILADLAPNPLPLDRLNCSVVDCEGKDNIPAIATIARAVGKPVLAIFDTDSDKTEADEVAINKKRNGAIQDAVGPDGALFPYDPNIEAACGVEAPSRKEKELRMRALLQALTSWDDVPAPMKEMMNAVDRFLHLADA